MDKSQIKYLTKSNKKSADEILERCGTLAKSLQVFPVFDDYKFVAWTIAVNKESGYWGTIKSYGLKKIKEFSVNGIYAEAQRLAEKYNLQLIDNPHDNSHTKFTNNEV